MRTGVTAILPNQGNIFMDRVIGGGFVLNGAGEVSGMTQVMEWGLVETPIMLTNTMSVGAVADGVARYMVGSLPGHRRRARRHHPRRRRVRRLAGSTTSPGATSKDATCCEAIQTAARRPGGGGLRGRRHRHGAPATSRRGIGTSSRKLPEVFGGYTLGVLVMSNFGKMHNLRVGGLPVGEVLAEKFRDVPRRGTPTDPSSPWSPPTRRCSPTRSTACASAWRWASAGWARYAAHGSGEIVVGFSTANMIPRRTQKMVYKMKILLDQRLDPLYEAVMEATEEAILNSMCMARPMMGINDNYCPALPLDEVRRFVDACRPIFASVKKRPDKATAPRPKEKPQDVDKEGDVRAGGRPAHPGAGRRGHSVPHQAGVRRARRARRRSFLN